MYHLDAVENVDVVALSPGGFLLIMLMAGGDYNQGVPGCGVATAHALARCGFGDTLLTAARTLHGSNLEKFLNTWCDSLRLELSTNSQGFLCRCERTLASSLPDSFPDVDILSLYVTPATSWSRGLGDVVSTEALDWKPREPTIGLMASFCLQNRPFEHLFSLNQTLLTLLQCASNSHVLFGLQHDDISDGHLSHQLKDGPAQACPRLGRCSESIELLY